MTPDKALSLVIRYAELNRLIKNDKVRFSDQLDLCQSPDKHVFDWWKLVEDEEATQYNEGESHYQKITAEEHGAECPHCYAAHLVIQERKAHRRQFAAVKGQMSRAGP